MVLLFEDLLCVCVRFKKFYSKSTFKALLYINLQQSSYYINSNKVALLASETALGLQLYQKRNVNESASKRISRRVGLPPPARLKQVQFSLNRKHSFFDVMS